MRKKRVRYVSFVLLAVALLAVAVFWRKRSDTTSSVVSEQNRTITPAFPFFEIPASPTPHPLTIPGIQQTPIDDTALTLDSRLGQNGNFTSHLASYRANGLRIQGLLTIPTGETPTNGWPAIVFLHGYIPPQQYQTTQRYTDYVNYLARSGFVVFKIDYRGHGDSEGEAQGGYFSPNYVIDTLAAIKALQSADYVNPKAIGLWAHSMSGNVAFRTAVVSPDVKAVVIWAGAVYTYTDLSEYRLNDRSYVPPTDEEGRRRSSSQDLIAEFGPISEDNPFWQAVAPTNFLSSLTAPVQLHHAENDSVVSAEYAVGLADRLQSASKQHELFLYQSGGHNLEGNTFSAAMKRTVEFFSRYLKDG